MSNNCLITKLNSAVSGNAPIFGCLEVVIAGTGTQYRQDFSAFYNNDIVISGNNDIVFSSSTTQHPNPFIINSTMSGFFATCTTDSKITITNKYNIRAVSDGTYYYYKLSGIKEIVGGIDSYIHSIPSNANSIELGYLSKMNLSDIIPKVATYKSSVVAFNFLQSKLLEGNINVFCNINNLKKVDVSYSPLVEGNISDFKNITTLENISVSYTQVSGTIEEFIAGQRASGRTSGSVTGNNTNWGNVTFNGATTHAKGMVSWTDNTITMDGVTINA